MLLINWIPSKVRQNLFASPYLWRESALRVFLTSVFLVASASRSAASAETLVVRWNSAALQAIRNSQTSPPVAARTLAMLHTAMYDAWAAYDESAMGTQYAGSLRRHVAERAEHFGVMWELPLTSTAARSVVDVGRVIRTGGWRPARASVLEHESPAAVGRAAYETGWSMIWPSKR